MSPHVPKSRADDDAVLRLFAARRLLQHAPESLSLEVLARRAGMSSFHFLRRFRATFGQTPHRLLIESRLARAKTLLLETDASVTEICFACGYESLGSFSALFRRSVGCSPREYRGRRARFWPVGISFFQPFIPLCVLDGFRGGAWE